jgi:hypothetical protein
VKAIFARRISQPQVFSEPSPVQLSLALDGRSR